MIIDHNWIENNLKGKYTINKDGSYDIDGNVDFRNQNVTKIDVKFNEVNGNFWCDNNELTSLKGCPKIVNEDFYCSNNKLKSLEGCPNEVNGYFYCHNNQLTSLEGCPNKVNGYFDCDNNPITSLPNKIIKFKTLYCYDTKLPFKELTYEEYLEYMMIQNKNTTIEQKHDIMKDIVNDLF